MLFATTALMFLAVADDPGMGETALTREQIRVVRDCVYEGKATIGVLDRFGSPGLNVPMPLTELYRDKPRGVLEVLLVIVEGANPHESALAAGFALALAKDPGAGAVCIEYVNKDSYDTLDKHWMKTPREHWAELVQAALRNRMAMQRTD
jgi:hypothetical protein